jgi:hypothetical protein
VAGATWNTSTREYAAVTTLEYINEIPTSIPEGKRLIHNVEWKGQQLNEHGFRAYYMEPDDSIQERCDCYWGSKAEGFMFKLLEHYRIKRQGM